MSESASSSSSPSVSSLEGGALDQQHRVIDDDASTEQSTATLLSDPSGHWSMSRAMASSITRSIRIHPLNSYNIGSKEAQSSMIMPAPERLSRIRRIYAAEGQLRTAQGVLITHIGGHPHILLLKVGNYFQLPGGRIKPGQDERERLIQKLTRKLAPPPTSPFPAPQWEIDELLAVWWRPNFDTFVYPYIPAHITKPKESFKLFLVPLPETCTFSVPKNLSLVAIGLFDLYDNSQRYGPMISSIPQMLARFNFIPVHPPSHSLISYPLPAQPDSTASDKPEP